MELLAVISGEALVQAVVSIVIAGLIFWLLSWAISACGLPEPFAKVARVVLVLAAVVILVNALMTINGTPFIKW